MRELVGHGVGRSLHEEPQVPNYGQRGKGVKLLDGLVIAIEPMINMGRKEVKKPLMIGPSLRLMENHLLTLNILLWYANKRQISYLLLNICKKP